MIRIKNFVLNNTYFNFEDEEEGTLVFSSRRFGRVTDEGEFPGEQDIEEAKRVKELLFGNFDDLIIEISYCDEWTYLTIRENGE